MKRQIHMKCVATTGLLAMLFCLCLGCEYDMSTSDTQEVKKVAVKTSELSLQQVDLEATHYGQVSFARTTTLYAEMSGRVAFLNARVGEQVQQGTRLVSFPPENHHLTVEQAVLALEELKQNYNRQKSLLDRGAVAKVAVSELKTQLDIQTKELERLRKLNVMTAPFTGVVTKAYVKVGEEVVPGSPLFAMAEVSSLEAEFFVNAEELESISVGSEITLVHADRSLKGKVSRKSIHMDLQRKAFALVATFDNPQNLPVVGGTAELKVRLGSLKNRILIPEEALFRRSGSAYVFLAEAGKARQTPVTIEQRRGLELIVKTGLAPGDQLITAGAEKLKDNTVIEVLKQSSGS